MDNSLLAVRGINHKYIVVESFLKVKPNPEDAEIIDRIIRNTYKVLFTRGQKGLYLYVMDEELRNYLRIEIQKIDKEQAHLKAYAEKMGIIETER